MKVNKPLIRKWVAALRSGKYHQTNGALCKLKNGQSFHCCLGVACRVAIKNGLSITPIKLDYNNVGFSYKGIQSAFGLASPIREKFGMSIDFLANLVLLNDIKRATFGEIANYIEKTLNL